MPAVASDTSVFASHRALTGSRPSARQDSASGAEPGRFAELVDNETSREPEPAARTASSAKSERRDDAPAADGSRDGNASQSKETSAKTEEQASQPAEQTASDTAPQATLTTETADAAATMPVIPAPVVAAPASDVVDAAVPDAATAENGEDADANAVNIAIVADLPTQVTPAPAIPPAPATPAVVDPAANAAAADAPPAEPAPIAPATAPITAPAPIDAASAAASDAPAPQAAPAAPALPAPATADAAPQPSTPSIAPAQPQTAMPDADVAAAAEAKPITIDGPAPQQPPKANADGKAAIADNAAQSVKPGPTAAKAETPDTTADPARPIDSAGALKAGADLVQNLGLTGPAGVNGAAPAQSTAAATAAAAAAPTPASPTLLPVSGVAIEIVSQMQAGNRRFEIRLDPPELGRIDVRLEIDNDGQVKSRLIVERAETLDMLRRDAPQLERALQNAGLKTADHSLEFSLRDQAPQRDGDDNMRNTPDLAGSDDTAAVLDAVRQRYGRMLGLGGGLDIRV